ncbi:hypothetical protein STEG23_015506, partial [Scotinomys teguina]
MDMAPDFLLRECVPHISCQDYVGSLPWVPFLPLSSKIRHFKDKIGQLKRDSGNGLLFLPLLRQISCGDFLSLDISAERRQIPRPRGEDRTIGMTGPHWRPHPGKELSLGDSLLDSARLGDSVLDSAKEGQLAQKGLVIQWSPPAGASDWIDFSRAGCLPPPRPTPISSFKRELLLFLQNLPTARWDDQDISLLLAEAYRLKFAFADAPNHYK